MFLTPRSAVLLVVAVVFGVTYGHPQTRLVGGTESFIGEFPFQVSLRKNGYHECGGTIITNRHILTAAHCIDGVSRDPIKEITIVSGTNTLIPGAGIVHTIKTFAIHSNFSNKQKDSWRNDVAVITLTNDIVFDMVTKPAELPDVDTEPKLNCVISGWGRMSFPKGSHPNNVRKANLTTISNAECNKRFTKQDIFESHLCAYASPGVGICNGDSGSALINEGKVVGITSFAIPCARGVPDVFTRVFFFLDFIKKNIATT